VLAALVLLLAVVIHGSDPLPAHPAVEERAESGLVPAALLKWPSVGSDYAVLVDKSAQKVFLYHRDNLPAPIRTFTCSTGENDGPKLRQNDRKTPEGIYFFTASHVESELAPIYGVRAFPIDYPNPLDGKEGRGGYGIWFHGTNKPLKPNDSNGCIVLENRDIEELARYIRLNDTAVVIASRIEMITPAEQRRRIAALDEVIEAWRAAWEQEDIDRYMSYYGTTFSAGRRDREQWREYKVRLASNYSRIRVEVKNLRLLSHDGVVLARFNQHYRAPGIDSTGVKRLYLRQNSTEWKIDAEFFKGSDRLMMASPTPPTPMPESSPFRERIERFIYGWKEAWEQKDLDRYIAFYATDFRSRGMDRGAWERHRERLNQKYRSVRVNISDLKVLAVTRASVTVRFKQDYRADGFRDYGLKQIVLVKKGDDWKIRKEEWQALGG
jgi:murein L,D-transpeptidase YafK